jgi:hypothetical protein
MARERANGRPRAGFPGLPFFFCACRGLEEGTWQVTCLGNIESVKITAGAAVRFDGHEYLSSRELSAQTKIAYPGAIAPGGMSLNERLGKIVLYGKELTGLGRNGDRIYEDIMRVVENNGQVTLPRSTEHRMSSRQIAICVAVVIALATLALAALARANS